MSSGLGKAAAGGTPDRPGEGSHAGADADAGAEHADEGTGAGLELPDTENLSVDLPDQLGPIEAFRAWRVTDGLLHPLSGVRGGPWHYGRNRAGCHPYIVMPWQDPSQMLQLPERHPGVPCPAKDCACGFWAVKTLRSFECPDADRWLSDGTMAFGRVRLWGRTWEFEEGWRAEYALPVAVFQVPGFPAPSVVGPIAVEPAPPELMEHLLRWAYDDVKRQRGIIETLATEMSEMRSANEAAGMQVSSTNHRG